MGIRLVSKNMVSIHCTKKVENDEEPASVVTDFVLSVVTSSREGVGKHFNKPQGENY